MKRVLLKRILIALALVAFCAALLAATKSYGIWVISGAALCFFILGLLRKEKRADARVGKPSEQNDRLPRDGGAQ